jgi:hypothetical protein
MLESCANRAAGSRGSEQQDSLAELLGTGQRQPLAVSEDANDLEHEDKTILHAGLKGNKAHRKELGEGHEPARWSASTTRNHGTVTQ